MMRIATYTIFSFLFAVMGMTESFGQKGSLFIIGGGERSSDLIRAMVETADLNEGDYMVVLPMATSVPEESIALISEQISAHTDRPITSFNFDRDQADGQKSWIDSVRNARLIYVTGGDQNNFMAVVNGTALYAAIHEAFRHGATIAGTSAGAAIMSEIMINGEQIGAEAGTAGFREVRPNYTGTAKGMGFLKNAIIDQHFIMRSRYNRLISLLADYPDLTMIGIDEGTAVMVQGNKAKVVGDSQVVVINRPRKMLTTPQGKASFREAKLSLYTDGQGFKLK